MRRRAWIALMSKKKINYEEGTVFAVPLRTGGFGRGLVCRLDGKGIIYGVFFGPKCNKIEDFKNALSIPEAGIVLERTFGDLGIIKGEWPILGMLDSWKRENWPVPIFARIDEKAAKAWAAKYDQNTLKFIDDKRIPIEDARKLPSEALSGAGAIEILLTKCLA